MADRRAVMRALASYAVLGVVALGLAGCGGDDPAPVDPTSAAATGFGNDPDTRAAVGVVEAYYAAVARADCTTMRGISAPEAQADDATWDGCGDALVELAGAGFIYEVSSGSVEGDTATFAVEVMQDAGDRTDEITLERDGQVWLVATSLLTSG